MLSRILAATLSLPVIISSAVKHLERSCVSSITMNRNPSEAYYGIASATTVLLVYSIPTGTQCWAKNSLEKDSIESRVYDRQVDVSNYKLIVLWNPASGSLFHAHLRRDADVSQDIEFMPYKNSLVFRLLPKPFLVEPHYALPGNPIDSLGSTQLH